MTETKLKHPTILRVADESDMSNIFKFIKDNKLDIRYFSPNVKQKSFTEDYLRHSLYNGNEEFILLETNSNINSLVSFKLSNTYSRSVVLNSIFVDNIENLEYIIDHAVKKLNELSINKPVKIKVYIDCNQNDANKFLDMFKSFGFKKINRNLFEVGIDCEVITLEKSLYVIQGGMSNE